MECCYIVICGDNTLYCGYSNNVEKRVSDHSRGCGAKYTKTRLPVRLVYTECFNSSNSQQTYFNFYISQRVIVNICICFYITII